MAFLVDHEGHRGEEPDDGHERELVPGGANAILLE